MPQPFYLPSLPDISPKPNVIRGGLPCSAGTTVNGVVQPGTVANYFKADPLINLGTTACYHFSDLYCYSGGPQPVLNENIALDLANNQHVCSAALGPLTYALGGFVFINNNATVDQSGVVFVDTDLMPTTQINDWWVSTVWVSMPAAPISTDNSVLFTYPDGSTWSLVGGLLTFTPVGNTGMGVTGPAWTWDATKPLQLGYSRGPATDGTSLYSVTVYVNGQKDSSLNFNVAYSPVPPVAPATIGFGPNSVVLADQFAFTALRFYMEDTTVSGNDPAVVVAADWVINNVDLTQQMATNTLPTP